MANGKLRESMKFHACLKGIEEAGIPLKKSQELGGKNRQRNRGMENTSSELDHF